jgi:hypothetical protein
MLDLPKGQRKLDTEFVNRERDLAMLLNFLPPQRSSSSMIVLKAPSGYGKTRLTKRVIELLQENEMVAAIAVEPEVRTKNIANSVYQGFYIQSCAKALDEFTKSPLNKTQALDFCSFLKTERLRRTKAINWKVALRKLPGLQTAYGVGIELIDRFLNAGDHSLDKILTSDSREAIETCSRYIQHVGECSRLVLVVREAQHIDQRSLVFLAELANPEIHHHVIFEYTLDASHGLNQLFDELVDAATLQQDHQWLRIIELYRLSKPHFEQLLKLTVPDVEDISGEYYLTWDGNLREIRRLLFSVSVDHSCGIPIQLENLKIGVVGQYQQQIRNMPSTDGLILCLILSHGEAISRSLVCLLIGKLNALATKAMVDQSIATLISTELVMEYSKNTVGIDNEDITEAIQEHPPLQAYLLLAKRVLRDHYYAIVADSALYVGEVSFAVRQTLRLSVELGDLATIDQVVTQISNNLGLSLDQSWYVSQIVAAVSQNADLFADQRDRLLEWAAEMAYEISDFRKTRDLLLQMTATNSIFYTALLSACCTETGDHNEALSLAEQLMIENDQNVRLAGQLVELVLLRCQGRIEDAKRVWNGLYIEAGISELSLYGYLLRFKELIADFPDCLNELASSSNWFMARGMYSSAAYSELTLASHLARQGQFAEAETSIAKAKELLSIATKDRHIILNNEVAVNLLSPEPDTGACCQKLINAIPSSGDDYSDIVLYTNLAVSGMLAGNSALGIESLNRALAIALNPRFADRDVFWGVTYNLSFVDRNLGSHKKIEIDLLRTALKPHSLQNEYWEYRFGISNSAPDRFQYMLSKPYHPMFLSHWTIDMDGLRFLKQVNSLIPPRRSTPIS